MSEKEEKENKINFDDLKPLDIKKSKGKFKTFTNGTVIQGSKFQPYLGKALTINIDEILSTYPSEDEIGTQIHSHSGDRTWKVLEEHETVVERLNE
tara:strand:+ start:203 stop:490 length:288 start_codon:yes stop_codon:yes gene_type:complete